MAFNNVLAFASLKAYIQYLPLAVVIVSAIFLVIAFIIGFSSGGARVSWGGFAWLISALGFVFADRYLHYKNPVYKMLNTRGFATPVVDFGSSITIAMACVFVVIVFYGLFTVLLKRKSKITVRQQKEKLAFEKAVKYGSYEGFDIIDQDDDSVRLKPTGIGRVLGGLICVVNTAMLIATLVCVALLVVNSTKLKNGAMSAIYTVPIVPKVLPWAEKYALDFAIIGIMFWLAVAGAKKGFTETIRLLVVWLGAIVALGLSFYLPFSRFVPRNSFLSVLVNRIVGLVAKLGWRESVYTICGKIATGTLLATVSLLAILMVNALLKTLSKDVFSEGVLGAIDKILAGVVCLILGAVLCALIWAGLYAFAHYGVFRMGGLTRGTSVISNGFFETFDIYLKPWLQRFTAMVKRIF